MSTSLLSLIAIIAIWKYQKWGAYLELILILSGFTFLISNPPDLSPLQQIHPVAKTYFLIFVFTISIIYKALFFFAIYRKWKLFK
jgi:hypothetical protein